MTIKLPVMKPKIPVFSNVSRYLQSMDESRIYSNRGPLLSQLEERYAEFFNVDRNNLVICSNATLALQGAAFLSEAKKFYAPAYTFPASLSAVINTGKPLELRDINESDWTVSTNDLIDIERCGLIYVSPFGAAIDFEKNSHRKHVIFDAAASIGSGNFNFAELREDWVVVFSLHATKVLGIGEGGIAIFGSVTAAEKFRSWINFGFSGNRNSVLPGINAKMSEISAAYGLASLDLWRQEENEWSTNIGKARDISLSLGIDSITSNYAGVNPYWIADFRSEEEAMRVEVTLTSSGIGTRRWWGLGCHQMPAFKDLPGESTYPVTDAVSRRTLGLPMFRDFSEKDWDLIASNLEAALR